MADVRGSITQDRFEAALYFAESSPTARLMLKDLRASEQAALSREMHLRVALQHIIDSDPCKAGCTHYPQACPGSIAQNALDGCGT